MLKCTIHNFRRISLLEKDILRGTSLPVTSYRSILGELATQRSKCSTNHRRPNHPGCCKNSPSSQSNPPLLCSLQPYHPTEDKAFCRKWYSLFRLISLLRA